MKEHPIIFNTEMVKAILEGRKTQTRRVIDPQIPYNPTSVSGRKWGKIDGSFWYCGVKFPYGQVGDRLWVRETWQLWDYVSNQHILRPSACNKISERICYKAECSHDLKWRSPYHMYRWTSRTTLEITNVRVERLQEIKNTELFMEGRSAKDDIYVEYGKYKNAKKWFIELWNSIHKKEHRWEDNPWVWVISFKRLNSHLDQKEK